MFPVDPAAFKIVDGKLYLNNSTDIRKKWIAEMPTHIKKPDQNWKSQEYSRKYLTARFPAPFPHVRNPDNKDTILTSAIRLFAAHGLHGVSVEQIARESGVGKTTLLHYYKSKERLYSAAVLNAIRAFERFSLAEPAPSVYQSLSLFFKNFLYWLVNEPQYARLLNRTFADDPRWAGVAVRRYWRPMLRRLTSPGTGREIPEATILILTSAIIQMAFSIEMQTQLSGGDTDALLFNWETEINAILQARLSLY